MSHPLPSPLPLFHRSLLRAVRSIVPVAGRDEWSRTWHAELWHMHHRRRSARTLATTADLAVGLTCDALWLRTESWRRSLSGTPTLCLATLLGLCLLARLVHLELTGASLLSHHLIQQFNRFLLAAPLVIFVTFATASPRHVELRSTSSTGHRIRRQLFFAAKTALVLLLSFLISVDLGEPIHARLPNTADVLQILFAVIVTLVGLRWSFHDQDQRCKQCLHALATPARVGRPSHNLLEWNGTELLCKHGHGRLSVPEMETSWCRSSHWAPLTPSWDTAATL